MQEQNEIIKNDEHSIIASTSIVNLIHVIRGQQVMFDSDWQSYILHILFLKLNLKIKL